MQVDAFLGSLQPITKLVLCGTVLVGTLITLKLVSPYYFVMQVPQDLKNPLKYFSTLLFIPGLKMNTILNLLFFYNTNNFLESSFLPNRYGEYLLLFLFVLSLNYVR
jgi:hypothetical protein